MTVRRALIRPWRTCILLSCWVERTRGAAAPLGGIPRRSVLNLRLLHKVQEGELFLFQSKRQSQGLSQGREHTRYPFRRFPSKKGTQGTAI